MDHDIFYYIDFFYYSVAYMAMAFLLFLVGKFVYGILHKKINVKHQLVEEDNFAFAIAHTGYFIGLLLAIGAAIQGDSYGLLIDLQEIAIWGLFSIILLNLSVIINDKIILRKFSVYKEIIEDKNEGTGVIEAASMISSGLIIFGAVSGEAHDLVSGITQATVFWLIGQFGILLVSIVYQWSTPYDIHEHIEKDNVAVGLGFAGAIIAIGNLIRYGIEGEFISWADSLIFVGFDLFLGLMFLPVIRYLTDKILLPGQDITDELINQEKPNVGAGLIEAFAYIGGSILITWCL
ncbi:DUF350 domain-containing protein [Candidatus Kapabacteria bacterium]|nr:DUF350 domain-containing protein [Candidatus Kapabacteria bacterium]